MYEKPRLAHLKHHKAYYTINQQKVEYKPISLSYTDTEPYTICIRLLHAYVSSIPQHIRTEVQITTQLIVVTA